MTSDRLAVVASILTTILSAIAGLWTVFSSYRSLRRTSENTHVVLRNITNVGPSHELDEVRSAVRQAREGADDKVSSRLTAVEVELERLQAKTLKEDRRYRLLQEYAAQGLTQSKVSFRVSLSAATLGFAVVLVGVALAAAGKAIEVTVVPLIAGAVVEAVAALFFVQDRRAQQTMSAFFDRLRRDRSIDDAIALMREVESPELRDQLRVRLSLHLVGLDLDNAFSAGTPTDLGHNHKNLDGFAAVPAART